MSCHSPSSLRHGWLHGWVSAVQCLLSHVSSSRQICPRCDVVHTTYSLSSPSYSAFHKAYHYTAFDVGIWQQSDHMAEVAQHVRFHMTQFPFGPSHTLAYLSSVLSMEFPFSVTSLCICSQKPVCISLLPSLVSMFHRHTLLLAIIMLS